MASGSSGWYQEPYQARPRAVYGCCQKTWGDGLSTNEAGEWK